VIPKYNAEKKKKIVKVLKAFPKPHESHLWYGTADSIKDKDGFITAKTVYDKEPTVRMV